MGKLTENDPSLLSNHAHFKRRLLLILALISAVVLGASFYSYSSETGSNSRSEQLNFNKFYFYQDPNSLDYKKVNPDSIRALENLNWNASKNLKGFGFKQGDFWVKVEVQNKTVREQMRVLRMAYPIHDYVTVFQVANGETTSIWNLGDKVYPNDQTLNDKNPALKLSFPVGESAVYLKVNTHNAMVLTLDFNEELQYQEKRQFLTIVSGLIYGVLLAMGLYNLLIAITIQDKAYFAYVSYVFSFIFFTLSFTGDGNYYLWQGFPIFNEYSIPVFSSLMIIPSVYFPYYLLNIRKNLPIFIKVFHLLPFTAVLYWLALPFLEVNTALKLLNIYTIFVSLFILMVGAYLAYLKVAVAAIYTAAWLLPLLGFAVLSMSSLGLIESNYWTQNASIFGGVIETIVLSLALAQRIRIERHGRMVALTEAFAAKEEAQKNRYLYEELFTQAPIGIARMDLAGKLSAYNNEFARMLYGQVDIYTTETLERKIIEIVLVYQDLLKELKEEGQIIDRTIEFKSINGKPIVGSVSFHLYSGEGEEGTALECYLVDVTARVNAERKHRQLEEDRMSAMEQLVTGVAHEMNTPLGNNIMAVTHLQHLIKNLNEDARSGKLTQNKFFQFSEEVGNLLDLTSSSLNLLSELVKRFKLVSVKQLNFRTESIELGKLFQRIHQNLEREKLLLPNGDKVSIQLHYKDETLKNKNIWTYPQAWESILLELVENTLLHGFRDFNGEERRVSVEISPMDGGQARLIYRDNGKGVESAYMSKIFDPFVTTSRGQSANSGLGMYQIYNIVSQLLRGEITVDNDSGIKIEVIFPLQIQ